MMYSKQLVAAVKVGGKVLRESSDRVYLPFGSEYSVLLKNLSSVRMQARISIDGKNTSDSWFVIGPNSSIEIERFVTNGNLSSGNRFKFIERTESVEKHRGVKAEDGLVRVEFKRERVFEAPKVVEHHTYHHHYNDWGYRPYVPIYPYRPFITRNSLTAQGQNQNTTSAVQSCNVVSQASGASGGIKIQCMNMMRCATNDAGITVPGSISNQQFQNVSDFVTEQSDVVVLHLIGGKGSLKVSQPVTTRKRLECSTCGKRNKSSNKFCGRCGTAVEII